MSATNDEEINELNETVLKKEDGGEEEVVAEATTEIETEPMEIIEDNENNEAVVEENNDEVVEENVEEVNETMEEAVDEAPLETNEEVVEADPQDNMNVDNAEVVNEVPVEEVPTNNNSAPAKPAAPPQDKALTEPAGQNGMNIYNGPIYCIEQVRIPPELPDIMKNYAKHIIRTQPDDVIVESYEYFKRLNKLRNSIDEYEDEVGKSSKNMSDNDNDILGNSNFSINSDNPDSSENKDKKKIQLSPLELESFYERLLDYSNGGDIIAASDIRSMAEDANIAQSEVNEAIVVGSWDTDVEWLKFWALIVAGSCSNLSSTLKIILDIIGDESLIPLQKATTIIEFLLQSDPNSDAKMVKNIISVLKERDDEVIEKEELQEILSELKN